MPRDTQPLLEGARLVWLLPLLAAAAVVGCAGTGRLAPWSAAGTYLLTLSIATWALFAWDKRMARLARRRVSEANLLGLAVLGGAAGAWWAMMRGRHKTRHARFRIVVPAAALLHAAALAWLAARGA